MCFCLVPDERTVEKTCNRVSVTFINLAHFTWPSELWDFNFFFDLSVQYSNDAL